MHGDHACGGVVGESKGGGVVLGTGTGVQYVEPGAAVPLNNDLAAARGEALAAEEAVLWQLTGLIIDHHGVLADLLSSVVWLDGISARHRCVLCVLRELGRPQVPTGAAAPLKYAMISAYMHYCPAGIAEWWRTEGDV